MKPYNFYLNELKTRSFYIVISYIWSLTILFINLDTIFLFEVYPLVVILSKRFIITKVTDFIDVIWYLNMSISWFFIFPLIFYHISCFFRNSWYFYQIILFTKLITTFFTSFFIVYLLSHNFLLPTIFSFFLQWESINENSLVRIESEMAILSYINWILLFKTTLSFSVSWFILFLKLAFYFIKPTRLHILIKCNRSILAFFFIFLLFLVTPPDIFLQISIICTSLFIFDFWFFSICLQLYKYKTKNAYNPSIT